MSLPGRRIPVNGIQLHVVDEGPRTGPPVLLLHGFPDSSSLWRHQIPALVGEGYRVIAPDLRGFGESDRPEGVDAYAIPTLIGDTLGLLDALSPKPRRSGAITRKPAAASGATLRHQIRLVSGQPWTRSSGAPRPSST